MVRKQLDTALAAFFSHRWAGVRARTSRTSPNHVRPAIASTSAGTTRPVCMAEPLLGARCTASRYTVYTYRSREKNETAGPGFAPAEPPGLSGGIMTRRGRSVQPRLRAVRGRAHATRAASGGRISRAVVVDAALRIVDRDGLDGVSMRRLAAAIGATPMALYRHVPNKAAL